MIAAARSRGLRPIPFARTIARFVAQSPNDGSRGRSITGATSSDAPSECAARVNSARRRSVPSITAPISCSVGSTTSSRHLRTCRSTSTRQVWCRRTSLSLDFAFDRLRFTRFGIASLGVAVRRIASFARAVRCFGGSSAMSVLAVVGQIEPRPLEDESRAARQLPSRDLAADGTLAARKRPRSFWRGVRTCVRRDSDTRKLAFDSDLGGQNGGVKLSTPDHAFKGDAVVFTSGDTFPTRCATHRRSRPRSPAHEPRRRSAPSSGARVAPAATYVRLDSRSAASAASARLASRFARTARTRST